MSAYAYCEICRRGLDYPSLDVLLDAVTIDDAKADERFDLICECGGRTETPDTVLQLLISHVQMREPDDERL